jgi:membrane protein
LATHRLRKVWLLIRDSAVAWNDDNIGGQGAALAYYTIFSLSPLLILVIVISSVGFGREAASGHLVSQIRGLIGTEGARFVQTMITNAYTSGSSVLAAVFSIVMLLLGASGVFVQLRDSLNAVWRVEQKPIGTIRSFLRTRVLSFAMILGIGFVLLVSLVLSAVLTAMSEYMGHGLALFAGLVTLLDLLLSFAGITVVFALMFKFLPAAKVKWKDALVGAAATSLLFSIGKTLIGLYLGNGSVGSSFGAASSLVIIMLWTFYSSQIVLFGAELTRLYAMRYGSTIQPGENAVRVVVRKVQIKLTQRMRRRTQRADAKK